MDIPQGLRKKVRENDALQAKRIVIIANKIEKGRNPHKSPGGRGQIAIAKEAIAWIECAYRIGPNKKK